MKIDYKTDNIQCFDHPAWHPYTNYAPDEIVYYRGRCWLCVYDNYNIKPDAVFTTAWQPYDHVAHDVDAAAERAERAHARNAQSPLHCDQHPEWRANVVYHVDDAIQLGDTCWVLCDLQSLTTDPPSRLNGWIPLLHDGDDVAGRDRLDMLEF